MMRCPRFRYFSPRTLREACAMLRDHGPEASVLAGGTDLVPNMKRRQQTPKTLVSLRRIESLRALAAGKSEWRLGATRTLAELASDARLSRDYAALSRAASQVATPHIRNMATLGGNLCLDTRCNYYDQNYEWRKAIDFCMKKDGSICWVAPGSSRCWAVSSTDVAPALLALGAEVKLESTGGERTLPLGQLYRDDGIAYLSRQPGEILSEVLLPVAAAGARSTYWKLRRRGSFDFPVLSVAAWIHLGADGCVQAARIVLGSVASTPIESSASHSLVGRRLDEEAIEEAAEEAARLAKPLDNTDFTLGWRKKAAKHLVMGALKELKGDDPRTLGPIARRAAGLVPAG
jgi:4-hydroxybenzoyl-CoA reductase subunit beta